MFLKSAIRNPHSEIKCLSVKGMEAEPHLEPISKIGDYTHYSPVERDPTTRCQQSGSSILSRYAKSAVFPRLDAHFEELITKLLGLKNENEDDDEYEKRCNVV